MENQNEQEDGINWAPALLLGTFVLGCSFMASSLIEVGQTIREARKAKKEG